MSLVPSVRRAYATVGVVAWFLISFPIANILVFAIGGVGRYAVFASPFDFIYGCTLWIFGVGAEFESVQEEAGFGLWTYFVAVLAYIGAGAALVVRRFARVSA